MSKNMSKNNGNGVSGVSGQIVDFPIADIAPWKENRTLDPEKIKELAASIALKGQDDPVELSGITDEGKRRLIGGHYRVAALASLNRTTVRAVFRDDVTTEWEFTLAAIRSNSGLTPTAGQQLSAVNSALVAGAAEGKEVKSREFAEELAASINKSRQHVQNLLRISQKCIPRVLDALKNEDRKNGVAVMTFDRAARYATLEKDVQEKEFDKWIKALDGLPADSEGGESASGGGGAGENASNVGNRPIPMIKRDALIALIEEIKDADSVAIKVGKGVTHKVTDTERKLILRALEYCLAPSKLDKEGAKKPRKDEFFVVIAPNKPEKPAKGKGKKEDESKGKGKKEDEFAAGAEDAN